MNYSEQPNSSNYPESPDSCVAELAHYGNGSSVPWKLRIEYGIRPHWRGGWIAWTRNAGAAHWGDENTRPLDESDARALARYEAEQLAAHFVGEWDVQLVELDEPPT